MLFQQRPEINFIDISLNLPSAFLKNKLNMPFTVNLRISPQPPNRPPFFKPLSEILFLKKGPPLNSPYGTLLKGSMIAE